MGVNLKKSFNLFFTFLKIGAFTFGGGYAMIPMIQREIVEKKKWINDEDILDIVAISESTPGPIAVNAATFVGYQTSGLSGAFSATVGVVLPSFVIISLIACIFRQFQDIQAVQYAFNGIRAGVLALIVKALVGMSMQCPKNIISYIIAASAFAAVALFHLNAVFVIMCSAVVGLSYSLIAKKGTENNDIS